MDEDDCDFQSPIGQIIKQINILCKKPKIDNQLRESLDLFNERVIEQQKYLKNGIFRTNFAEAALFLQSCSELYGKKIDLLWDELIGFLTRLIQYDCDHDKEQGKEINQDVIIKLEERRNKFKRKRKSKKEEEAKQLYEQSSNQNSGIDPDLPTQTSITSDLSVSCEVLENFIDTSNTISQSKQIEICQIPGWNDIQCLFEQIDERQLPDKNNLLAILKVCAYGRMRFMEEKKLPLDTPYSTYKDEYCIFRKKFFEEAVKKWQNVTLETFEDLHKVLTYLAQKKKTKQSKVSSTLENILLQLPSTSNTDTTKAVDEYLGHSDDDSLFELSFICDDNNTTHKSNLFVHLEQLSTDIINNKLRQDSGFYEFNSDDSCHSSDMNINTSDICHQETPNQISDVPNVPNAITNINILRFEKEPESISEILPENRLNESVTEVSQKTRNFLLEKDRDLDENKENHQPPNDFLENDYRVDSDTESILSDHNYCSAPLNIHPLNKKPGKKKISGQEQISSQISNHAMCVGCKIIPKIEKMKPPKEKKSFCDKELMPPPSKIRKLPHKQIIKLLKGLVPSVAASQFETFFNENYQPDFGEGIVSSRTPNLEINNSAANSPENENRAEEKEDSAEENENTEDEGDNIQDKEEASNDGNGHTTSICYDTRELCSVDLIENLDTQPDIHGDTEAICYSITTNPGSENRQCSVGDQHEPEIPTSAIDQQACIDIQSSIVDTYSQEKNISTENNSENSECIGQNSDNEDTLSVFSEHSYCQLPENVRNDSGFVDMSEIEEEDNIESLFLQVDNIVAENDERCCIEEEYQRILHLLEESQKDMINEKAGLPTEEQRKVQEALELHKRVQNWRDTICPILEELNEQEFDIHEYGTKIMDGIGILDTRPFSQIVDGMTSSEVIRYFISSLQLANTNNIEICGVKPGQISNDFFEIKLINRDRYHEHITDYQAPSKESLRDRLQRLRNEETNKNKSKENEEDPISHCRPPHKRRRVQWTEENSDSTLTATTSSVMNNSYQRINPTSRNFLVKDSNNNRNKTKENAIYFNHSSKSYMENPQKGKSIKRKSFNNQHVSFEGSQAPQALSVQITSPRQLYTPAAFPSWSQSTSSEKRFQGDSIRFVNDSGKLDDNILERDFQRLRDVQRLYPNCQLQSTPREDATTFSENSDYRLRLTPKALFE